MKKPLLSLSQILEKLFQNKNSIFSEIYFLYRLKDCWSLLVGEEISKRVIPVKFQNEELTLNLPDSTHLQEMHFAKDLLRQKINKQFPEQKIKNIVLRVNNLNSKKVIKSFKFKS